VTSSKLSPIPVLILLLIVSLSAPAQTRPSTGLSGGASGASGANGAIDSKTFEGLGWRSIGPAIFSGRTADVEGIPGNPNIVYVASASGGLWKTANGGITWRPIFERQGTLSIGDIALEPNNPEVIWVGTGEANTRNSVSFGDGVYRSTDGGKTWQHLGLRETMHISRVIIHPGNPKVVYVAAIGHAFGPNEERGVFMTSDGGKTWQKTLYLDAEHGACDLEIDPQNPNILYAAMWRFERKPWTFTSGSEKGGVFRSVDGGLTWTKLSTGLPKLMGRIGVKVAPSNPNVVYVIAETKEGTMYRSDDKGDTFRLMTRQANIVSRGFYYTDLRIDPQNENRVYAVASTLFVSIDGGRTYRSIAPRIHIDYHALWIDPLNPKRMWCGQDGGVAVSYDQGESWEYVNNIPIGQPYHVYADNRQPFYWVMGGMQDNGSWTGPGRTREPAGILNDDWRMVSFGDGFKVINHPDDPEIYLSLSQGGNLMRTDMRTREQQFVKPWVGGSGGAAANQKYRFNWNAPLVFSPHNKTTVLLGGNIVFKSPDFGKTWEKISPDLTTNDPEKLKAAGGPVADENTTAEYHCTIISLNESPAKSGMIWAGTDDGNLQLTINGGKNWTNLTKNVAGLPPFSPVSHVEPSITNADIAYVSFDRHMLDDFKPYVFKTTDGGKTWADISGNLPAKAYVHVLKEDPKKTDLIYAGTELGLYATYDGGRNWIELGLKNLPRVAVHDIAVHPRENDLILATHGRSFWIFDDATPIQQMNADLAVRDATLFDVRPAIRFTSRFTRYGIGDKLFAGPNPPNGALITYYLKDKLDTKIPAKIQILDPSGKVIRELTEIAKEKGFNRVSWDISHERAKTRRQPTPEQEAEARSFGRETRGPAVIPGTYTVKLIINDKSQEKKVNVGVDPSVQVTAADLQTQFDYSMKLREMISATNTALRSLDGIKEQLRQIEKTVKEKMPDAAKDLAGSITEHLKQTDALLGKLATPQEEGLGYRGASQLSEKLSSLLSSVQGVNAAPTPAQREFFDELQQEFQSKMPEVNKFLNEQMPKLNETLRKNNASTVIVGRAIEMPR
jgi:photosystem II stability/assembly factor-like uncharacterized protein